VSAIEEIAAERRRQIESEGWTPEAAPGYVARRIELAEQRELWVSHLASLAAYSEQVSDALKDAKDEIERLSRERGIVPDGWDRIVATLREFSSLRAADGDYWEADAAERAAKEIERIPAENRPMLSAAPQTPSVSSEIERLRAELEKADEAMRLIIQQAMTVEQAENVARDFLCWRRKSASPVPQNGEGEE
jgi:hypothetical protein